jgi:hypothetical protein
MTRLPLTVPEFKPFEKNHVFHMEPRFPKLEVIRLLGGSGDRLGSRHTIRKVQAWTKELVSVVKPALVYSVEPVAGVTEAGLELENGQVFESAKVADSLQDCRALVCFVGTLGAELDETLNTLSSRKKYSEAAVVDAVGSVGAESLVEHFHRQTEARLRREGHGVTLRFSPGYCDWPLGEQVKLFELVEAQTVGVKLLESCLMQPGKSVSGVFGITKKASAQPLPPHNPCLSCPQAHCKARRKAKHGA